MTADEIMGLLAAYGEDRFYQRFNGPGALALQLAIQRVVEERDEAMACNDAMRDAMRELRVMVAMPAEGEGVVLGAVARALEKTLLYSSDNARLTRERDEARAKLAKQIAVAEALANVRQQIERFPAMTVEAKREAAREALQSTASTLRKLATTGGYCQELVNAAAEVESIFDWLYLPKPVDDVAAPLTRRSHEQ